MLGTQREVPARLWGRGADGAAAETMGNSSGEGVEGHEHTRGEDEEEALDDGLRPGSGGAKGQDCHGLISVRFSLGRAHSLET